MYKIQKYFEKRVGVCVQLLHELTARKGPGALHWCWETDLKRQPARTTTMVESSGNRGAWNAHLDGWRCLACACATLDLDVPE